MTARTPADASRRCTSSLPKQMQLLQMHLSTSRSTFASSKNNAHEQFVLDSARDRPYALDTERKEVIIVDHASQTSGAGPHPAIAMPTLLSLAIDAKADRLYVGNNQNTVYVFDAASTLGAGSAIPAATIHAAGRPASESILSIYVP